MAENAHPEHKTSSPRVIAYVLSNTRLTPINGPALIHHIVFGFERGALDFEPGDVLGVRPRNCPIMVDEILAATGFDAHTQISTPHAGPSPLRDALIHHLEIRKLTANHIRAIALNTDNTALAALLKDDAKSALQAHLHGRELIDVLLALPGAFPSAQHLVDSLARLVGRLFVIANCPTALPGEAHILAELTQYESHGKTRKGVTTRFLIEEATAGESATVFVHKHKHFRLPLDRTTPIIMIGPGTGLSPFRAFLQQRARCGAVGGAWLFVDECAPGHPPLLASELISSRSKTQELTQLTLAPHLNIESTLHQNSREIWHWVNKLDAVIYICGQTDPMSRNVESALLRLAQTHGGYSENEAAHWMAELAAKGKFLKDVY